MNGDCVLVSCDQEEEEVDVEKVINISIYATEFTTHGERIISSVGSELLPLINDGTTGNEREEGRKVIGRFK